MTTFLPAPQRHPEPNTVAELVLLASIVADDSLLRFVASMVRIEDFYLVTHQEIFRAMLALQSTSERITFGTLERELVKSEQPGMAQRLELIRDLLSTLAVSIRVVCDFVDIVRHRSHMRQLACVLAIACDQCSCGVSPTMIIAGLQQSLASFQERWDQPLRDQQKDQDQFAAAAKDAVAKIEHLRFDA